MMSAPASRYWRWMSRDDVGPRQHQHVVVALEVVAVRGEALAAEVALLEPVPLNHRAHRAVEDGDAVGRAVGRDTHELSSQSSVFSGNVPRCRWPSSAVPLSGRICGQAGSDPPATSTVNGSPERRAPTRTVTSSKPARGQQLAQPVVAEAEPLVAELRADPGFVVLAEDRGRARGRRDAGSRRASASAASGGSAWWSACDSSATSTERSFERQPLELAALPDDVLDLAARRPSPARAPARPADRSTAMTRRAQRAASIVRYPSPQPRSATSAAAAAGRARATRPPSSGPGTSCRRSLPPPCCEEALLPHPPHFLEPRIVGARRRASVRVELGREPGPERRARARRTASASGARRYQVNVPARSSTTRPASRSRPRWRDTPDCARPRTAVSSETFSASRDRTRSSRSRTGVAEQPQQRRTPLSYP